MQRKNSAVISCSFVKSVAVVAIVLQFTIVHGHPGYGKRFMNENDAQDAVLDFAQKEDLAAPINELLGSVKERQKRLSDQRRAELETLIALSKMTGKLVSVSRGGRQLDTAKIGRRRRSVFEWNLKSLRKLFRLSGNLGQGGNAVFPVIR